MLTGKGQLTGKCFKAVIKLPDISEIMAHTYWDLATNFFVRTFFFPPQLWETKQKPRGNHKNSLSSQTDVTSSIIEFQQEDSTNSRNA